MSMTMEPVVCLCGWILNALYSFWAQLTRRSMVQCFACCLWLSLSTAMSEVYRHQSEWIGSGTIWARLHETLFWHSCTLTALFCFIHWNWFYLVLNTTWVFVVSFLLHDEELSYVLWMLTLDMCTAAVYNVTKSPIRRTWCALVLEVWLCWTAAGVSPVEKIGKIIRMSDEKMGNEFLEFHRAKTGKKTSATINHVHEYKFAALR